MDKIKRLLEITETYERFEAELKARGMDFGDTPGGGFWTATRWDHLIPFLESATRENMIQPPGPIVDAGSGDGRVSAVLDVYGFKPIINIELDERLVDASREVIDDLVQRGIVSNSIQTVRGDFTTLAPYNHAGTPFKDVQYFYTGMKIEPLTKLADKIAKESPKGTKLIVYGMIDEGREPSISLQLERRMRTKDLMADFLIYSK